MPRQISSLICASCGVEFLSEDGGMCSVCRRPFCGFDLYVNENDAARYCHDCFRGAKAGKRLLAKSQALTLWTRRQLILSQRRH